jgi:hypothetical protein
MSKKITCANVAPEYCETLYGDNCVKVKSGKSTGTCMKKRGAPELTDVLLKKHLIKETKNSKNDTMSFWFQPKYTKIRRFNIINQEIMDTLMSDTTVPDTNGDGWRTVSHKIYPKVSINGEILIRVIQKDGNQLMSVFDKDGNFKHKWSLEKSVKDQSFGISPTGKEVYVLENNFITIYKISDGSILNKINVSRFVDYYHNPILKISIYGEIYINGRTNFVILSPDGDVLKQFSILLSNMYNVKNFYIIHEDQILLELSGPIKFFIYSKDGVLLDTAATGEISGLDNVTQSGEMYKFYEAGNKVLYTAEVYKLDPSQSSLSENVSNASHPASAANVAAPSKLKKVAKETCANVAPEYCDTYLPYCKQTSTGKCQKKPKGPELDAGFVIHPEHRVGYLANSKVRLSTSASKPASVQDDLSVLSEVKVPSPQQLVVSDLPKSNSGVGKTEQVMEQVMAANVSKGMLSRQKSVEILASPAAQQYVDLRQHLTQDEVRQLDADMTAVHDGVETILGQHLSSADEKKSLQKLFDEYDLCKYVRTADDKKLTIPKLTAILESFGQVEKRVRLATTRSTICYIILSVVLMDPKTFIEKLSGINKGSYSKK